MYKIIPQAKDKKVILYAPTFRGEVAKCVSPDVLDVKKFADNLAGLEYSSMSEEQFKEVYSQLEEMAEYISDIADLYVGIQGILNNLYCLYCFLHTLKSALFSGFNMSTISDLLLILILSVC